MATAILSSRNSLNHRFDHGNLTHHNPNSRLSRHSHTATTAPRRRKRIPTAANTNLVMGQVKILKRGETLSAFPNKENNSCGDRDVDLIVASTKRLGPEPEIVKKHIGSFKGLEIVAGDYAGPGCSVSPPPSSVPIPCFLGMDKLFI